MKPEVNDLRLLKLAEMYALARERFVAEIEAHVVDDPDVRAVLQRLIASHGGQRARLASEILQLNAGIHPEAHAEVVRAALLDIREAEEDAREFYRAHADRLREVPLAHLFQALAQEAARDARLAEDALRLADRKARRAAMRARGLAQLPYGLPLRHLSAWDENLEGPEVPGA